MQITDLHVVFDEMGQYLATQRARVTQTVASCKESAGQDGRNLRQTTKHLEQLSDLMKRTHETLQELDQLQEGVSGTAKSNKKGKQIVSRFAWVFRDKKKAEELCRRLRQNRENLAATISIRNITQL